MHNYIYIYIYIHKDYIHVYVVYIYIYIYMYIYIYIYIYTRKFKYNYSGQPPQRSGRAGASRGRPPRGRASLVVCCLVLFRLRSLFYWFKCMFIMIIVFYYFVLCVSDAPKP